MKTEIKKQFSLEEYNKNPNRKVVTRDGRKVRIICTDKKVRGDDFCIVGLVFHDAWTEDVITFRRNGECGIGEESFADLFFVQEKHEGWVNLYENGEGIFFAAANIFQTEDDAMHGKSDDCIATCKIEWLDCD